MIHNYLRAAASALPHKRALLVGTCWAFCGGCLTTLLATDCVAEEPSWKQGISSWNGSGYELPPAATNLPSPLLSDSPAPYTVPIDPTAPKPANDRDTADWQYTPPSSGEIRLPDGSTFDPTVSLAPPTRSELSDPLSLDPPTPDPAASDETLETLPPPMPDGDADVAESIDTDLAAIERAPLHEEVTRWYQYPLEWMRGWNSHAEFGLDGSEGNSTTLAIQTGLEMKRATDAYTLAVDIDYRQANNRNVTTEDNGRFNVDYDRLLGGTSWSAFTKYGMEWDRFKAFDLRLNVNGGLGYYWIRDDTTTLATRFGAGASRKIGAPLDDDWVPEAVFGLEAERQLTSRQKLKGRVDYFPAWENFSDYRIVTDFSWEILLDGSENLSLKLAATDRYDSTPQGAEPNDIYYSLLLLYKF
jgi:putative salt-induced outer membrane protein YdiY